MKTTELKKALNELSKNIKNHLFNQDNKQNTAVSLKNLKNAAKKAYGEHVSNKKEDTGDTYLIFTKRLTKICKILDKFISIEINSMPEKMTFNNNNKSKDAREIVAYQGSCQGFINLINSNKNDFQKFKDICDKLIDQDSAFRDLLKGDKVEIESLDFVYVGHEFLTYANEKKGGIIELFNACQNLLDESETIKSYQPIIEMIKKGETLGKLDRDSLEALKKDHEIKKDEDVEKKLIKIEKDIDETFNNKYGELKKSYEDIHKKVEDLVQSFKVGKDTINKEIKPFVEQRSNYFINNRNNGDNEKKLMKILLLIEKNNSNLKSNDSGDVKDACEDIVKGIKATKIGIQYTIKNEFLKLKNDILKAEAKREKENKL